jgi:ABC-type nitrate/sulfonate/bicarbonate transport system substrate-binding protein
VPVRAAYAAVTGSTAPSWLAKETGIFEKYGLDVDLQLIASGPTLISSLLAGETDFAAVAAPAPMNANLQGGDTVLVATTIDRPTLLVIVSNEIRQLTDLRGKPVGVTRAGTLTDLFMRLALKNAGLDPANDVQILSIGGQPETVAALQSGHIASGVFGPPSHQDALALGNMHVLVDFADLGIPWPTDGIYTTRRYSAAQPERVQSYLKAMVEAVEILRTDRERFVSVLAKYAQMTDRAAAEQTWGYLRNRWVMPPYPDRAAVEVVIQEALIPTDPNARQIPPEAYYDDHFVREMEASGFIRQVTGR